MTEAQPLDYANASASAKPPSRRGKGFLALCGNPVMPGLGYFIAGMRRRGLIWFAIVEGVGVLAVLAMCVPSLVPTLIVLGPIALLLHLWVLIDGYRRGKRSQAAMLSRPLARYALGIGLIALSAFLHPNRLLALYLRDHWVEAFSNPTIGMAPAIDAGDRFLAHKRIKWDRWSVVVFISPESAPQRYVKRIVGLPGEEVELVGDEVHINGKAIELPPGIGPYQSNPPSGPHHGCQNHPMKLSPDEYFVLGDNSTHSGDSRWWRVAAPGHQPGAVPQSSIIGVATWIYWPPSHWHRLTVPK